MIQKLLPRHKRGGAGARLEKLENQAMAGDRFAQFLVGRYYIEFGKQRELGLRYIKKASNLFERDAVGVIDYGRPRQLTEKQIRLIATLYGKDPQGFIDFSKPLDIHVISFEELKKMSEAKKESFYRPLAAMRMMTDEERQKFFSPLLEYKTMSRRDTQAYVRANGYIAGLCMRGETIAAPWPVVLHHLNVGAYFGDIKSGLRLATHRVMELQKEIKKAKKKGNDLLASKGQELKFREAGRWLIQAIHKYKNSSAAYMLSVCYQEGIGFVKRPESAERSQLWLQKTLDFIDEETRHTRSRPRSLGRHLPRSNWVARILAAKTL